MATSSRRNDDQVGVVRLRHYDRRAGIREHEAQSLVGKRRVERQVGAPRLEDREQADEELRRLSTQRPTTPSGPTPTSRRRSASRLVARAVPCRSARFEPQSRRASDAAQRAICRCTHSSGIAQSVAFQSSRSTSCSSSESNGISATRNLAAVATPSSRTRQAASQARMTSASKMSVLNVRSTRSSSPASVTLAARSKNSNAFGGNSHLRLDSLDRGDADGAVEVEGDRHQGHVTRFT